MNSSANGTAKKILIGVGTALLLLLITQVFVNTSRISVLEAKTSAFEDSLSRTTTNIETNRTENRFDHKSILDKLDKIESEIVKK